MSEEKIRLYSSWLKGTIAAIKKFSFYPPGHPTQAAAISSPFEALQSILAQDQKIVISLIEDRFVINGLTVPEDFSQNVFYSLFKSGAIQSIQIKPEVTLQDLRAFLNYFVKRMVERTYQQTIVEYLAEQALSSVIANQIQYVEVSSKQEVISKTEKIRIDLKAQVAQSLKENPQILREMLFGGEMTQNELKEKYQIDLPVDRVVKVVQEEVSQMSDQDLLNLAASKVKKELEKVLTEEVQKKEDLEGLLRLIQSEEMKAVFPRLEEIFSRYGLFNQDFLKKEMSERWNRSEKVIAEIDSVLSSKPSDNIPVQQLANLAEKILRLKDEDVSTFVIEKLAAEIEAGKETVPALARMLLENIFNQAYSQSREFEFSLITEVCFEKIKVVRLKEDSYRELARLSSRIAIALLRKRQYPKVKEVLLTIRSRCHKEVASSPGIRKACTDFLAEVGNAEIAKHLVQEWLQDSDTAASQEVEAVLRLLGTEPVVEELVIHSSGKDEKLQQRISALLVDLPEASIAFFNSLLGSRLHLQPGPDELQMATPDSRRSRLALKVLGKIEQLQALNLIGKLKNDPDPSLRLEVVKSLSKHPLAEARGLLYTMLKDPDSGIRKDVIEALVESPDSKTIQALLNHFSENRADRRLVYTALAKLGGGRVTEFFLSLLTGQSQPDFKLSVKADEEIRSLALNYLSRHLTQTVITHLENYLESQKKNFFSFLRKDPLEQAIASLISRSKARPGLPIRG